ncbi:MAG TPA: hypothetical protein PLL19_01510, partial [Thiobacillaceae bacterium]|nr:hypothetical protein [Thiobacillaceae bacterium]
MNMTLTRRQWLAAAGGLTATTALPGTVQAAENTPARWPASSSGGPDHPGLEPGQPGRDYTPVSVPGGAKLPWKIVDGVKVYHLIAEE